VFSSHKRVGPNLATKTNRGVKNIGIILHVDLLAKYDNFKKRQVEIYPNPPKILTIS
jgi:hypothetical protein